MAPYRRALLAALKIGVSAALVAWLLHRIGVSEIAAQVGALPLGFAAVGVLLFAAYTAVASYRWLAILRALDCPALPRTALRISFVGSFFSQVLPATIGGDAVRVWEACRAGIALDRALRSVVYERIAFLLVTSIAAAAGAALWAGGSLPAALRWSLSALAGAGVLAAGLAAALGRSNAWLADWRKVLQGRVAGTQVLGTLAALALLTGATLVLAAGLGIALRTGDCIALLPAVVLISALPISMAGWGVRELAMVTVFGYAGVPAAQALALSLCIGVLNALSAAPGGLAWLRPRA
jgi:hypothetical protein